MLRKIFSATVATAALALSVTSAHAIILDISFTVTAHTNPATGLQIGTTNFQGTNIFGPNSTLPGVLIPNGPPGVFDTPLFEILVGDVVNDPITGGGADNLVPRPISVLFNISGAGGLSGSGTVTGTTAANLIEEGELHWAGPLDITLSDNTHLTISLTDAEFGDTFNGVVFAQLSYVPEPGTLALLAAGFMGLYSRRRLAAT